MSRALTLSRRPAIAAFACCVPALAVAAPPTLAPPPGSVPIASLAARGVQIYPCVAGDGEPTWGAAKPEAELLQTDGSEIGRHFEGPTWETQDGSRVVGSVIAQAPAPQPGAVTWLLLSAQGSGPGMLAETRYVLRRDTDGGEKPTGSCSVGQIQRVPYTATYTFFR